MILKNIILQLMNNSVFWKNHGEFNKTQSHETCNIRKKKKLFSARIKYHRTNFFPENLLAIEVRKSQIFMNKPAYLGLSILELSKTVMYEFRHDYMKPKYKEKSQTILYRQRQYILQIQFRCLHRNPKYF